MNNYMIDVQIKTTPNTFLCGGALKSVMVSVLLPCFSARQSVLSVFFEEGKKVLCCFSFVSSKLKFSDFDSNNNVEKFCGNIFMKYFRKVYPYILLDKERNNIGQKCRRNIS